MNSLVGGDQRQTKHDSMGNQHPVNRVTMNIGQLGRDLPKIGREVE